jgi:hypothetical protein
LHQYDHMLQQHSYRPPHYPSILNPIPEISEQQTVAASSQSHCQVVKARQSPSHNNNNNNNNNTV